MTPNEIKYYDKLNLNTKEEQAEFNQIRLIARLVILFVIGSLLILILSGTCIKIDGITMACFW